MIFQKLNIKHSTFNRTPVSHLRENSTFSPGKPDRWSEQTQGLVGVKPTEKEVRGFSLIPWGLG